MTSEISAAKVFVQVLGFTDAERRALDTVFRLSEQRETVYSLWRGGACEPPRLALIDGQSQEARLGPGPALHPQLKFIWVDAPAQPGNAWRTFERPLSWAKVLDAMDQLFAPPEAIDFDLDIGSGAADPKPPDPRAPGKRALIASADRNERLYLRAKLALAELTQADEAETGAQALELARAHQYAVALVDFGLPDVNCWAFLRELAQARPAIPHVIVTKAKASAGTWMRARLAGARGCFGKPPHPGKLQDLLQKV